VDGAVGAAHADKLEVVDRVETVKERHTHMKKSLSAQACFRPRTDLFRGGVHPGQTSSRSLIEWNLRGEG